MIYSTYRIIRTKPLENGYHEIILQGRREMVYEPGNCLSVYDPETGEDTLYIIASGLNEPWVRIIVPEGEKVLKSIPQGKLKIRPKLVPIFPDLMKAKDPVFICEDEGISFFLSYISTYPKSRAKLCCIKGIPNEEYVKNYGQAQIFANLDDLKINLIKLNKMANIYIAAQKKSTQAIKNLLASVDISSIKWVEL